jgi:hypothetical protein
MYMSQGHSLCSNLKQIKILWFFFSFTKSEEGKQVLPEEVGTSGGRRRWGKGKYCVHMYVSRKME